MNHVTHSRVASSMDPTVFEDPILPALAEVRKHHNEYQKKAVEVRVESNAMQLMDNGIRAYTSQGQPIPTEYLSAIQEHLGQNLGVSPTSPRFQ